MRKTKNMDVSRDSATNMELGICLLLPVLIHHQAAGRLGLLFWREKGKNCSFDFISERAIWAFLPIISWDHGLLGNSKFISEVFVVVFFSFL